MPVTAQTAVRAAAVVGLAWALQRAGVREQLAAALASGDPGVVNAGGQRDALVVRRAPQMTAALALAAALLIIHGRQAASQDAEEREWVAHELEKRRDRLQGVLESTREALQSQDEDVNVDVVLSATEDVADVLLTDSLVEEGLHTAARCVVHNLAHIGFGSGGRHGLLTAEDAQAVQTQLSSKEEVIEKAETWLVKLKPIRDIFGKTVARAERLVYLRRSKQISKALALLERAKSQLPYLVASGLLSVLSGSIYAVKTHLVARVTTLAFERVSGGSGAKSAGGKSDRLMAVVRTLAHVEVLHVLSDFVGNKIRALGRREFITRLKTQLFRSLITQDLSYLEQQDMHVARSLIGNAGHVCTTLFDLPLDVLENASSLVSNVALLVTKSSRLTVVLGVLLPLRLLATSGLDRLRRFTAAKTSSPLINNMRDIWTILVNPVGVRTLRIFAREPIDTAIFSQGLKARDRFEDGDVLVYQIFDVVESLVEKIVDVSALACGGYLSAKGLVAVADISSFTDTALFALARGQTIYYQINGVFSSNGVLDSAERMFDLLNSVPKIGIDFPPEGTMPSDADSLSWSVEFKGVSFAYPTRPQITVLRDVTLSVREGERIGILGESGCGKSTLVSLLLRLYDTDAGVVEVAGRPIAELNPLWLRRNVAVVSQSIYLPFNTVKENLLYGAYHRSKDRVNSAALEEEMREALRVAQCEDLFFDKTRFPQQWHTNIGRDGTSLSGGERQRLCIARAILARPRILVLDEATSALDEESQYKVQEAVQAIHDASKGRLTIITIAHRLSNFRHVDRLAVLEKGQVVEQGTPRELLDKPDGIFANFVEKSRLDFLEPQPQPHQGEASSAEDG